MGIFAKTFAFTAAIITLVVVLSSSILYFVLPDFYLRTKNTVMLENAMLLEEQLKQSSTEEECINLISDFIVKNNSTVLAFDKQGTMLPTLSAPFVLMDNKEDISIVGVTSPDDLPSSIGEQSVARAYIWDSEPTLSPDSKQKRIHVKVEKFDTGSTDIFFSNRKTISDTRIIENQFLDRVVINATLQPIDEAKGVIASLMPFLLVADSLIALTAAYFFARHITRPILKISAAAQKMHKMTSDIRSGVRSGDEIGKLSENLDNLYINLLSTIDNLRHEMEKTNRLEESKTHLIRAASHELKTPLAALNGITEGMIDNVGVYKDREKYLAECKLQIEKLSSLVNDILTASQIDSEIPVYIEELELRDPLEQALSCYHLLMESKEIKLSLGKINYIVHSDRRLLYNTFSNLISNAVKYTVDGGKIHIFMEDNIFSLENQCQPISQEEINKLFEPFYTQSYSRNREQSGTGLGLYIVKKNLDTLDLPFSMTGTQAGVRFDIIF